MSTSSSREACVRAYLSALTEFESALAVLDLGDRCLRDGLAPFADLATHLTTESSATAAAPSAERLWRPRDPAALQGITDVYEVPGRFAFQGDTIAHALLGLAEGVSSRMRLDVVGIGPDQDRTFLAALAARGRGELRLR